ncbi:hypothetical protein B7494_g7480 [Chlorociboria aeruginascens]|nr:hypothetical protein B7494_g7480 [Chlorociboria aeruginascens]
MLPTVLLSVFASLLCQVLAAPSSGLGIRDLNSFIAQERPIALQGALNNIGPNGNKVSGATAGHVVASPSKANPNYFYTWTRDSALTLKMIIDEVIFGNSSLQHYVEEYIQAQAVLQTVTSPSGGFLPNGAGLGEPKFQVDGSEFNGAWGRPQRDGPALRAIALISYSNWLIKNGQSSEVKEVIWPIIANDLSYVGQYWNQTGFDLWEETKGSSFFTIQNQHRSLVQGTQLAQDIGVTCATCDEAPYILCFLQSFWNGNYTVSNINVDNGRTGLDGNSILGPIAIFDIDAYCDSPTLQPCHSKSLANFKVLMDDFRQVYTINQGIAANQGIAVGRYAEDVYMGGNPWYLITTAAAEFLYDAVAQWKARHNLYVDSTSLAFFQDLYPSVEIRKYDSGNANSPFSQIMDAVTAYADSFAAVAQKYTPSNGSLAEQFNRDTGVPLSADDLTWSYAAFVTMAQRQSGQYPASWGSRNAAPLPSTCTATSTQGVYQAALAAGAPNVTAVCQVSVLFNVNASTYYGENIYIIGNTGDLGAWGLDGAMPLSADNYTQARPLWYLNASLVAGESIDYKFVREEDCTQPYIYETVNRTLTVPACGEEGITVDAAWTVRAYPIVFLLLGYTKGRAWFDPEARGSTSWIFFSHDGSGRRSYGRENRRDSGTQQSGNITGKRRGWYSDEVHSFAQATLTRSRRNVVSGGSTGIVSHLECGSVRKSPYPSSTAWERKLSLRDIRREFEVYQQLQSHNRLVKMIDYQAEIGITLEFMPNGNLRNFLREHKATITMTQRFQWVYDAAEGLYLLHSHDIIHCDVKPENYLLDSSLRLRIIDFSGSSIGGSSASAFESVRFCLPRPWDSPSTIQTDLFAFGSTIYEIMTGRQPYEELTDKEVLALFEKQEFPSLDLIPCAEVIRGCWFCEFSSVEQIAPLVNISRQKTII